MTLTTTRLTITKADNVPGLHEWNRELTIEASDLHLPAGAAWPNEVVYLGRLYEFDGKGVVNGEHMFTSYRSDDGGTFKIFND